MTVEDKLSKWAEQPGAVVAGPEHQFIEDMRTAAQSGVGYGWMQQVIEWEWQSVAPAAWGPEHFNAENARLRADLEEAVGLLRRLLDHADSRLPTSEIWKDEMVTRGTARAFLTRMVGGRGDG